MLFQDEPDVEVGRCKKLQRMLRSAARVHLRRCGPSKIFILIACEVEGKSQRNMPFLFLTWKEAGLRHRVQCGLAWYLQSLRSSTTRSLDWSCESTTRMARSSGSMADMPLAVSPLSGRISLVLKHRGKHYVAEA